MAMILQALIERRNFRRWRRSGRAVYFCFGCGRLTSDRTLFVGNRPYHSLECWKETLGA